jgi:UDP-N-acetylglucosamine pyrophosphorylase
MPMKGTTNVKQRTSTIKMVQEVASFLNDDVEHPPAEVSIDELLMDSPYDAAYPTNFASHKYHTSGSWFARPR